MILGLPGFCLWIYVPSCFFVAQAIVFTEVLGLMGMGIRVGTDRFPLQLREQRVQPTNKGFHAKLAGSTCYGTGALEHLCLLDGNRFSLGSCQLGQQELVICFSCGKAGPDIGLFSKPDLSGSWKTGAFQDPSIYEVYSCLLRGQD